MTSHVTASGKKPGKLKFLIGGGLIVVAILYLIISSTQASAQYFLTVEELQSRQSELVGDDVRISGVVLGDTIEYDIENHVLHFAVAHIPGDQKDIDRLGGIAQVLHDASLNESLPRLNVVYYNVKPDLLKNEAQAIMTGSLNADGTFTADELLLKCPTKYEEAVPDQVVGN